MLSKDDILNLHSLHTGALGIKPELPVTNKEELAEAYTPGVAVLAKLLAKKPKLKSQYTMSGKLVAVITDGSAVLGLGSIGSVAGLPVVEGKALLHKALAGTDSLPLILDQVNVDEFVETVKNMANSFAAIHLEDIAAPRCFEIEKKLSSQINIPVYHDDQEGTAIAVLAGLKNASKVINKPLKSLKVIVNGIGASGYATAKLLFKSGIKNIVPIDKFGIVTPDDNRYNSYQRQLAKDLGINSSLKNSSLSDLISNMNVFIGLSEANVLAAEDVAKMGKNPIIFALANPDPEINPQDAKDAGAKIVATGSSQFENQVNNILVFPGLFKGILQAGIKHISYDLQENVADALSKIIKEPTAQQIIPDVLNKNVVETINNSLLGYIQRD